MYLSVLITNQLAKYLFLFFGVVQSPRTVHLLNPPDILLISRRIGPGAVECKKLTCRRSALRILIRRERFLDFSLQIVSSKVQRLHVRCRHVPLHNAAARLFPLLIVKQSS